MLTQMSADEKAPVDEIGISVFANVDENTLETLDRCADEEVLPRSWLISRILQEWAGQRTGSRSDSVTLEEGAETASSHEVMAVVGSGSGQPKQEIAHIS